MQSDPKQFIVTALAELEQQTAAHQEIWHLGAEQQWAANLDTGTLALTFADGTVATAPIQIVGTYDSENGTFLWAWEHPSVPEPLRTAAQQARQWGEANAAEFYASPRLRCSEQVAWEFTAVTARLGGAKGAYRAITGSTQIYMTFAEVSLARP